MVTRRDSLKLTVLAVVAALGLMATVPTARAGDYETRWGAIAYSPSTGKYGYSQGWLSEVNARRVALANCKASDAKIIFMGGNYWIALALGDDVGSYGYGYGETQREAEANALRQARKHTSNCYIAVSFYSAR